MLTFVTVCYVFYIAMVIFLTVVARMNLWAIRNSKDKKDILLRTRIDLFKLQRKIKSDTVLAMNGALVWPYLLFLSIRQRMTR